MPLGDGSTRKDCAIALREHYRAVKHQLPDLERKALAMKGLAAIWDAQDAIEADNLARAG